VPHADVVLGHPSALPVGGEVYGYPTDWPAAFTPAPADLAELHKVCRDVRLTFTAEWNVALRSLSRSAPLVSDALAAHGDQLLFNYPEALHDPARTTLLPPHVFLGSAVRTETVPDDVRAWLEADDRPLVYVSFGSFLSARGDVLATVLTALRSLDVRVAVATGSARDLPAPGQGWLVRDFLPQTALLARAALAVTHGGNNTVTEALTFGVPMLVLPFSTDQFAGAAAIERTGLGAALDPNAASAPDVIDAVRDLLAGRAPELAAELGSQLRATPGPELARSALA
jgi:UDP:flavonoid glycosyltransferase YjiC (YdhE family)